MTRERSHLAGRVVGLLRERQNWDKQRNGDDETAHRRSFTFWWPDKRSPDQDGAAFAQGGYARRAGCPRESGLPPRRSLGARGMAATFRGWRRARPRQNFRAVAWPRVRRSARGAKAAA